MKEAVMKHAREEPPLVRDDGLAKAQAEQDAKTSVGDRMEDVPGAVIPSFCRTRRAKTPS